MMIDGFGRWALVPAGSKRKGILGINGHSVPLEIVVLALDAVAGHYEELEAVADLDMALCSRGEGVAYQGDDLVDAQVLELALLLAVGARDVLVLEVDLVVEEGHDEGGGGAAGAALLALVGAHGVEGVHRAAAVAVEASDDGVHVVREESLAVEQVLDVPRGRSQRQRLVVVVKVVPFDAALEPAHQRAPVGCKPVRGHHDPVAAVKHLGLEPRVDRVVRRVSGVPREDRKVLASNSKDGSAVVSVRIEAVLDRHRGCVIHCSHLVCHWGWCVVRLDRELVIVAPAHEYIIIERERERELARAQRCARVLVSCTKSAVAVRLRLMRARTRAARSNPSTRPACSHGRQPCAGRTPASAVYTA